MVEVVTSCLNDEEVTNLIELMLLLSAMFGLDGENTVVGYHLEFGTRGFSGYTISEPAAVPVEEDFSVFQESIEERQPLAADRSETRRAPVENTPVSQDESISQEPVEAVQTPQEPVPVVSGGILGIAAGYVGSPYVLYGNPPHTFDCSSYVWWVYKQAGIDIPMTVNGQKAAVTPVSNPQPGDLIFYNDFHHVGIYAGNGMTYEALNPSAGVRYGTLVSANVWYGRIG